MKNLSMLTGIILQAIILMGVTLLAALLYFVGIFVLILAAPFSKTARRGLRDLAYGRAEQAPRVET